MRRFVLPGVIVTAAIAVLALLTFGVSNHTDTASIDAQVASHKYPVAPNAHLALPGPGQLRDRDPGRLPRQGGGAQRVRVVV